MPGVINQIEPPAIPLASTAYNQLHQQQIHSVHRLFYNRITNALNAVLGTSGGQYIDCPNGLFFDITTQSLLVPNTGYPVTFAQTYLHNAVSMVSSSRITISVGGVYNFQFSGQVKSSSSSAKQVWLWIVRNGVAIGYSTHQYTLAGSNTHLNISWNFDIDMQEGQYVQLYWGSDSTSVTMEATAATSPHPGIPSAVMAVNYVAPLPATLPTPP